MPSYNVKPQKPKVVPTPEDPAVSDKPEPIKLDEDFVSVAAIASEGRERLLDKLRAHRDAAEAKAKAYTPPPPSARQLSRTELEMEAGRRAVARAEAAKVNQLPRKIEPSDGYTTPAFRPADYVPGFDKGQVGAKTIK